MIGALGVVGLEHEELRADPFGELAVDRAGEHDPPLVEHAPEEVVVERDRGFGGGRVVQLHGCRS